jgi:VCBS repeat protein
VDVNHGANVWVEHNVFDFNRHAISAGKPDTNTGYTAIDNLVLKGGGYHGTFFETWTQQFDIHGDRNCWDVFRTGSLWNCGHAGDRYDIRNNVFQYTHGLSFRLRGTPADGAYLERNIFSQSEDDSIHQNETGMVLGSGSNANTFDRDTFGEYGVCDFDGDGKDDLFLATGISWWYMSGADRHWVFLRDSSLQLRQVGLGDLDGDGHCDVLAPSNLSREAHPHIPD